MKAAIPNKILSYLAVGAIAIAVLSPSAAVLGAVWEQHIELLNTQNLVEEVNNRQIVILHHAEIADFFIWLSFFLPICVCAGIFVYDRYQSYRTTTLKQQIEMLERVWQRSIYQ
jgi:hypothetical protein